MSEENIRQVSWRALLKDLRLWLGVATGIAGTLGGVLIEGQRVLQAPKQAAAADATAKQALERATSVTKEFKEWKSTMRIIFCTKPDWLSTEARAHLECWRIQVRDGRRLRPPRGPPPGQ